MSVILCDTLCKLEAYEAIRIAIWNRNRIVVALAAAVWTTNVSFLIQGKSITPPPAGGPDL